MTTAYIYNPGVTPGKRALCVKTKLLSLDVHCHGDRFEEQLIYVMWVIVQLFERVGEGVCECGLDKQ